MTACYPKVEKRFRARIMLPVELLLFSLLLGMAFIGGAMDSGIHRMMAELGQATAWSVTMGGIAAAGLGFAIVEWAYGEHWPNASIRWICTMRMWASAGSIVCWLYLAHTIYYYADVTKAQFPLVLGPICIAFHLWTAFAVRQVTVLLDPDKDTRVLEAKLERQRRVAL